MYRVKRSGPRTEPCGTPVVIGEGVVVVPLIDTDWVLLFKYEERMSRAD